MPTIGPGLIQKTQTRRLISVQIEDFRPKLRAISKFKRPFKLEMRPRSMLFTLSYRYLSKEKKRRIVQFNYVYAWLILIFLLVVGFHINYMDAWKEVRGWSGDQWMFWIVDELFYVASCLWEVQLFWIAFAFSNISIWLQRKREACTKGMNVLILYVTYF